jgi:protein-S-isoprenylcysteine O-methyltransferase Ste14
MWIPTPIYEALPYLYILFGVLFFSGTAYIGLSAPGAIVYIGAGIFSIVYGAMIFAKRQMHRQNSPKAGPIKPA